jgi:hypothetical protein
MEALGALPTTLQGVYARILDTLKGSNCYREALFMLQYVLWARKPPLFSEMIDAIAVRLDESPGFKQENRLFELMDVVTQCSSLLTPVMSMSRREIHLAHSSVKEYLTSQQLADPFRELLSEVHAKSTIAKTSIRYMIDVANIHHDSTISSSKSTNDLLTISSFPAIIMGYGKFWFLRSARYWAEYARAVETADDDIAQLILQLYGQEHLLLRFPQILGLGFIYETPDDEYEYIPALYSENGRTPRPLTHACYWGLETVVQRLLESDTQIITSSDSDGPLHAASFSGHHSIVKMLLDRGAAVDGRGKDCHLTTTVPLHGASRNGHIETVKTLLEHGARIDVLGFSDETAIEVAVWYGHQEIVQLLMDSCDSFTFRLLFLALSRWPVKYELVSLPCSKRIVVESQVSSAEFTWLLSSFMQRGQPDYALLLLNKGPHVPIPSFGPQWNHLEPPGQNYLHVVQMLPDRGVFLPDYLTQCAKLLVKKKHNGSRKHSG